MCDITGYISTKRFDRNSELKRYMLGHRGRNFACPEPGCDCRGAKAFARADKVGEHMQVVHGKG